MRNQSRRNKASKATVSQQAQSLQQDQASLYSALLDAHTEAAHTSTLLFESQHLATSCLEQLESSRLAAEGSSLLLSEVSLQRDSLLLERDVARSLAEARASELDELSEALESSRQHTSALSKTTEYLYAANDWYAHALDASWSDRAVVLAEASGVVSDARLSLECARALEDDASVTTSQALAAVEEHQLEAKRAREDAASAQREVEQASRKLDPAQKEARALKANISRAPQGLERAVKKAEDKVRKQLASAKIIKKGVYTSEARAMARSLVHQGCAQEKSARQFATLGL
ncbi:hypothetical protein PsYK624_167540 [Phanerochaete sordida]|uniref:Uncharacterized protein n=1 Tax=Phanerochaete sordida TaxID=48140 RepID=A0A9P3LMI7_9APHY|nr:hypothetical protein PsYK624_167540 [Phanerochaete sordida]